MKGVWKVLRDVLIWTEIVEEEEGDMAKLIHGVAKETWLAKANIHLTQCKCNLIINCLRKQEQQSEG